MSPPLHKWLGARVAISEKLKSVAIDVVASMVASSCCNMQHAADTQAGEYISYFPSMFGLHTLKKEDKKRIWTPASATPLPLPLLTCTNFTQVGSYAKGIGPGTSDSGFVAPAFLSNGTLMFFSPSLQRYWSYTHECDRTQSIMRCTERPCSAERPEQQLE